MPTGQQCERLRVTSGNERCHSAAHHRSPVAVEHVEQTVAHRDDFLTRKIDQRDGQLGTGDARRGGPAFIDGRHVAKQSLSTVRSLIRPG